MIAVNHDSPIQEMITDSSTDTVLKPETWMRHVLGAAAVYNLIWGALAIIAPLAMLGWLGVDTLPLYPEFWQCIGMIVGVYGIGYAIASRDAYRHWPIVLVGLLGKIFGPIGFLGAVLSDRLPQTMSWTIVTNDLIWWIPFSIILWRAARAHQSRPEEMTVPPPRLSIDPLGHMLSQFGSGLDELSRQQPVLLVFLRHSGCTFCRETLADLAEQREQIESLGTKIALVHTGQQEPEQLLARHGLTDLHCFRDPTGQLYELFGLKLGRFGQLFGITVWRRGPKALLSHGIGRLDGNGFRMPGAFLFYEGTPVRAFRHHSAADRPDYIALSTLPEGCEVGRSVGPPRESVPSNAARLLHA